MVFLSDFLELNIILIGEILELTFQKWSILYDTGGRRYGIETTNHAECYNMVMRHVRGFPHVGIVEFIMYDAQGTSESGTRQLLSYLMIQE